MNYQSATEKLGNRETRKVANNTYLQRRDAETIAVKLHSTDVVTFKANGDVILDSGGWKTVTTKARMNEFSGLGISQTKGLWSVSAKNPKYTSYDCGEPYWLPSVPYADGITWNEKTGFSNIGEDPKKEEKLRASVRKFASQYMKALAAGKIPEPSAGDCFFCGMKEVETGKPLGEVTRDHSHILSHMEEKYFVPSLVVNAFKAMGASQVMYWGLGSIWGKTPGAESWRRYATDEQATRMLKRYIYRQLGVA